MGNSKDKRAAKTAAATERWGSDVIVDLLRHYKFPHAPLNPGSSFRGLHDSMINYGGNRPQMLLCPHEEVAVQIAHGYAKATGEPLVAILHNLVGLLHANMAIYYAYLDRAPVFIVGATGPLAENKRRPRIDWIHTANVQGEAVRNYTKWDYQPASIDGFAESFSRAYSIMMTEPTGPVYMCYDAGLQETPLDHAVAMSPKEAAWAPTKMAPDPAALAEAAERLVAAEHPVIMAEFVGRGAEPFEPLVKLAETLAAPVVDISSRLNFPTTHPLNMSEIKEVFANADVLLNLDVRDWEKPTTRLNKTERRTQSVVPAGCHWIDIGFGDVEISGWSMENQRPHNAEIRILADTSLAIPELTRLCRRLIGRSGSLKDRLARRSEKIAEAHRKARAGWAHQARENWDASPITLPRLALEVWDAIKSEDWVLTANSLESWTRKLWDFDRPWRHPGRSLGTATQIGISLGVALAHKGKGRLVVDIQPDGDLMFDPGALWVATKYEIPMLIVMYNNRAYYNDWEHQILMARLRGTDEAKAHIGMDLFGPEPDFAGLARSFGWYAEGPIDRPGEVGPALRRAIAEVKSGRPALLDTITQKR
ncbi:MAG: thiamine pyrophosphate-binding protein [Hyphomicrobiales bacterium]|nr:thiamine pyrophosphate-binding protein [Hyphomicrobiales bacterium]